MKLSADEFDARLEAQLFEGAEIVSVEVRMLRETYDDIQSIIKERGWDLDHGLRSLLGLGLGYVRGEQLLQADDKERKRLADWLQNREAAAAVMKFHAFDYSRDNKILRIRESALRSCVRGLESTIERLRCENETLKEEIKDLSQEIEQLRLEREERLGDQRVAETPATRTRPSWITRLLRLLRR